MPKLLAIIASVAALTSAACKETKQLPVVSGPTVADSADQVFYQADFVLTTKGVQRGNLKADTAYVLEDQTRIDLRRAHVVFTTETGAPQGTMESDRGNYSTRTQILDGRGNVVLRLVDGRTLTSPHVTYNQLTHQVTSDTNYTIKRANDTQSGIGFTSNQTFTSFSCLRSCVGSTHVLLPEK
ncbi:MAG: LPS export ABC transporter periplasmic protein LptC [Gemmatimonadaceae bacterium]